jgi:hypothetical protein
MSIRLKNLQSLVNAFATGFVTIALLVIDKSPASAISFPCTGTLSNGIRYDVSYSSEGGFYRISFPGLSGYNSDLRYYRTDVQNRPVYRGEYGGLGSRGATISVVDLSRGNVRSGSQISVGVNGLGWGRGTCSPRN